MKQQQEKCSRYRILFLLALGLSASALFFLYRCGFLTEQLSDWRTPAMFFELLLFAVFLLFWNLFFFDLPDRRGISAGRKRSDRRSLSGGRSLFDCTGTSRSAAAALTLLFAVCTFLWVHRIFLPLVVTGLYCAGLTVLGEVILTPLRRREVERLRPGMLPPGGVRREYGVPRLAHHFLTGCAAMMVFLCFLSGTHVGGLGAARKGSALLLLLAVLLRLLFRSCGILPLPLSHPEEERFTDRRSRAILSWILLLLLLHAGRMNITLDYDSVHYGLRSQYILDNGRGIFENLGAVNAVYYYPKGLELLTLPLSGTPTYGFVLSFSFWCGVLVLLLAGSLAERQAGKGAGVAAAFLTACIPGIMNLSTSAKTDMATLLFQLLFLRDMLEAATEPSSGPAPFFFGAADLLMTLCLKPTAIAFSGILFIAAVLFFSLRMSGSRPSRRGLSLPCIFPAVCILLPPALALFGVTLRTLHLTGYPLVTVFTGIWERLGMHGSYPLAVQTVPDSSASLTIPETAAFLARRIAAVTAAPTRDEDLHILIAWGTPLFPLLLMAIYLGHRPGFRSIPDICSAASGSDPVSGRTGSAAEDSRSAAGMPRRDRSSRTIGSLRLLQLTLLLLLLFDLLTLKLLYQVDGNYYNLSYALAAVTASAAHALPGGLSVSAAAADAGAAADAAMDMPENPEESPGAHPADKARRAKRPGLLAALSPAILLAVFLTGITNWAGARGFTEPRLLHRGFYDHEADVSDYMILTAKDPFYRYIKNAPRFRLLTLSEEPECYLFPCCAMSYTDLEGSGGNVRLVKTLNDFKDYLEWAEITLLYTEEDFLQGHGRAAEIVRYMEEDGSISPIITQEGCTLYEYHAGIRD